MNEQASRISALIIRFLNNELDEDGKKELNEWKDQDEDHRNLFDRMTNETLFGAVQEMYATEPDIYNRVKRNVAELNEEETRTVLHMKRFTWLRMVAAAAIFLFVAAGAYFLLFTDKADKQVFTNEMTSKNDAEPGQFKARLTLSDGSVIILDSAQNKLLAQQGSTKVLNKDGKLVYEASKAFPNGGGLEGNYNTLTTAKGETYVTILSDGSRVWLNSKSSLRYPVNFSGEIRHVVVTGEAYFEVAASQVNGKRRPFIVNISPPSGEPEGAGMKVEVLGTTFNISAYTDEDAIRTTLLEGKVKVVSGNSIVLLKPGEQAMAAPRSPLTIHHSPDVDEAVAWHYGRFQFNGASLQAVLRQLVRWYDVEIEYKGAIPQREFWGKISRSNTLSQVLGTLEANDIHFKIDGKKIIVSP